MSHRFSAKVNIEPESPICKLDYAWRVTLLGYPSARQFLKSNGYMVPYIRSAWSMAIVI